MKRVLVKIVLIAMILVLTGCSFGFTDKGDNLFNIRIAVKDLPVPNDKKRVTASINQSIISRDSWFMFEIRIPENKGPIWIPGKYEGKGTYSAEISSLQGKNYLLYGHFYATGGIHFSQKYNSSTS